MRHPKRYGTLVVVVLFWLALGLLFAPLARGEQTPGPGGLPGSVEGEQCTLYKRHGGSIPGHYSHAYFLGNDLWMGPLFTNGERLRVPPPPEVNKGRYWDEVLKCKVPPPPTTTTTLPPTTTTTEPPTTTTTEVPPSTTSTSAPPTTTTSTTPIPTSTTSTSIAGTTTTTTPTPSSTTSTTVAPDPTTTVAPPPPPPSPPETLPFTGPNEVALGATIVLAAISLAAGVASVLMARNLDDEDRS